MSYQACFKKFAGILLSLTALTSLSHAADVFPSKPLMLNGFPDDVKDIKQELQHMYVCVPHVRKSTTDSDRNLLSE
jgi:hypothetical protein